MINSELLDDLNIFIKDYPNIKMIDTESGTVDLGPDSDYDIHFYLADGNELSISACLKDPIFIEAYFWNALYWVTNDLKSKEYYHFKDTLRKFAKYPSRILRYKRWFALSFRFEYYQDGVWHPDIGGGSLLFPFFEKVKHPEKKIAMYFSDPAYCSLP